MEKKTLENLENLANSIANLELARKNSTEQKIPVIERKIAELVLNASDKLSLNDLFELDELIQEIIAKDEKDVMN